MTHSNCPECGKSHIYSIPLSIITAYSQIESSKSQETKFALIEKFGHIVASELPPDHYDLPETIHRAIDDYHDANYKLQAAACRLGREMSRIIVEIERLNGGSLESLESESDPDAKSN